MTFRPDMSPPSQGGGGFDQWWRELPPPVRTGFLVFAGVLLGFLICALASCRPTPRPERDTTNVVVQPDTMDSVGTDSILLDQYGAPGDTLGLLPEYPDSLIDSLLKVPSRPRVGAYVGLGYGLTNYDPTQWCTGVLTATMLQITPDNSLRIVKLAAKCQVRVVLVPSRPMITTTGRVHSPFSPARADAFSDELCQVLTPDVLDTYGRWIIGLNLGDDYASGPQWGGQIVTQAQIAAWAKHTRERCGDRLPLGIRVEPAWAKGSDVPTYTDYAWAQYRKGKGDPNVYFDKNAAMAKQLGLRLAMTVNVRECDRTGSDPCTPSELQTFGRLAVLHPDNCVDIGWKIDETPATFGGSLRDVHLALLRTAKERPLTSCR